MVCVYCDEKTHVFNSRAQKRLNQVWRRRRCFNCQATFTSVEGPQYESSWQVQHADGRLEPYSRDQLFITLYESCKHRKAALRDARALADTITLKLTGDVQHGVVTTKAIISTAQVALNRFDRAASVHYAAFHQN